MNDYTALAGPAYFLLIAVEVWRARKRRLPLYRLNDAVNDISTGLLMQLGVLAFGGLIIASYVGVYQFFRLWDWASDSGWTFFACFVAVDIAYYFFHRLSHEINFLWAAHIVHHQSEDYNLAVALRQSALQPFFAAIFYLPLAVIGFPPEVFFICGSINTIYQFWLHTRMIGDLGPLEAVFVTPSHHRVHHGRNPIYLDRNHGGTFIVWDRLFGTFEKEAEEVVYGVTYPLQSWNPVWANLHYWRELLRAARRSGSLAERIRIFLASPGWYPESQGGVKIPPAVTASMKKFDPPYAPALAGYAAFQFALLVAMSIGLVFYSGVYGMPIELAGLIGVAWGILNLGGLFETRTWSIYSESLRVLCLPVLAFLMLPGALAGVWGGLCLFGSVFFVLRVAGFRSDIPKPGKKDEGSVEAPERSR